jgi:lysine 6-dehydrogenase
MKALVIGAGGMGRAAAWDLARQPGIDVVRLVDRSTESLVAAERELARALASGTHGNPPARVETEAFDLDADDRHAQLLSGFDVALSAADYRYNATLTRAAIEAKTHLCDLGGNLPIVHRQLAMNDEARRRGITVVPDCGLAPGLACQLAALGVERLETADTVKLRVGGLPAHPRPPLGYKLVFSVRGLTNEYLETTEVVREGRLLQVHSLDDIETITFPAPFGVMEAFNTSGGASTLTRTLRARVTNLDYKTIRYPGHCAIFAALRDLGFLAEQPLDLAPELAPRVFTERLLSQALADETDTDVVLMRVEVTGTRGGERVRQIFEMIDRHDADTGHSAMARTTGYSAAAVAYMLAAGAIQQRGVLPGEHALPLEEYLAAVRARGLNVSERLEPG